MQGIKTHYANVDNFFMTPGLLAGVKMAETDLKGKDSQIISGLCPSCQNMFPTLTYFIIANQSSWTPFR